MTDIEDSFRKQLNIFYFSHMRRVAQALFDTGANAATVAANLLLSKPIAQRWQTLHELGLLFNGEISDKAKDLTLPFANPSPEYHWKDCANEVKYAAKIFFDMGLGNRAIAIYLGVPVITIYFWLGRHRKGQFKTATPRLIKCLKPQEEVTDRKLTRHSYETRRIAKDCFVKGMHLDEVAVYLGVPRGTIYEWHHQYREGCFYTNAKEKLAMRKALRKKRQISERKNK